MTSGETIKGPVIEVVKGGLILDIGLRGFLPASLVDLRRVRDLQPFVGTELECKIIELDRNRNNVVLSRRAFLEESQSEGRKKFLENLKKGERRKGTVSSIVNFGAFVDLGGVDGLVHVSELSWKHVDHPQEVVSVGQEVEVEVLDVDLERERVSLSLKATQEDPWKEFERTSTAGSIITGQVTKLVPFGAFVRVGQGIEGLVHISEISHEHVDSPESVLAVGQEVEVKVIDVDVNRRRVSLSMRQVSAPAAPKPKEIVVEEERPTGSAAPDMSTAIEVPEEILAAVAAAESSAEVEDDLETADAAVEVEEAASEIAETTEDPVVAAEATEVAEEAAAVAEAAVEAADGATEEEVSLEAILEDLKRREGHNE
jgi:small subunit ribosomal protein S1